MDLGITMQLAGQHVTLYKNSWLPGGKFRYFTGEESSIYPGLFVYSGFGMGYLYLSDGSKAWCSPSEAQTICRESKEAGVVFRYVDSFHGYSPIALGDR